MADLSDKHFQQVLRDIVLPPEARRGGVVPQGKPVPAGWGEHWFDGRGNGGGSDQDKGKDPDKDGKGDPPKGGDPPFDPRKPPKEGDPAEGVGPFYPCGGEGNCVNVRLDGMVPPPDGWADACSPPEIPDGGTSVDDAEADEYGPIDKSRYYKYELWWGDEVQRGTVRRPQRVAAQIKAFFPENLRASWGTYGYDKDGGWALQRVYDAVRGGEWGRWNDYARYPPYDYSKTWGVYISVHYCADEPADICGKPPAADTDGLPKTQPWPPERCAEIVATEDGFQAACANVDMRLPPNMTGTFSAFELCDGDGNRVTMSKDELRGGWTVDTPTYTAHINSDFRVQNVYRKPSH